MSDTPTKPVKDRVTRRLYSLYPEQIKKLEQLAKQSGTSQSQYLRELIDVAYVEKVEQPKTQYGRIN